MNDRLGYAAIAVAGVMLLLAPFGDFPYGYFQILRWIVCSALIFLVVRLLPLRHNLILGVLALLLFIYNPIATTHFSRGTWGMVNIATLAAMAWALLMYRRQRKERAH